jgi:hypothetical protein
MIKHTLRGRYIEAAMNYEYQRTGNLCQVLGAADAELARHAIYLSQFGLSHRPEKFLVGSTASYLLLYPWAEIGAVSDIFDTRKALGEIVIGEGANNSPKKGVPRDCGEMGVLNRGNEIIEYSLGDDVGRLIMLHLYSAGPGNPRVIATCTGLQTSTLHPCDECRPLLAKHPSTWPAMPITTLAHDRPGVREDHIQGELLDNYREVSHPVSSRLAVAAIAGGA